MYLKGSGIYMIGILGSLSDVVGGFSCMYVHSSCNLLVNIKGLESTFFLFLPLTKLPHPNTTYRCISHGVGSGVLALERVLSRAEGATCTFVSREGGEQNFTGHPWPKGDGKSE